MIRFRFSWRWLGAALSLMVTMGCEDNLDSTGPDRIEVPPPSRAVTSADADLEDSHTGSLSARYPGAICTPVSGTVVIEGTIEIEALAVGEAIMIGLIDKAFDEDPGTGNTTWGSGAYAYFGHIGSTLRIGPSDGFLEGEVNQVGASIPFPTLPATIDFGLVIDATTGKITVSYGGSDYVDDYGEIEDTDVLDAYPGGEFDGGAIIGLDMFPTSASSTYRLKFVSGCTLVPSDDQGPLTSAVAAAPNPVAVGLIPTLTANVDDASTGGSTVAAAEYSYSADGGLTWSAWQPMNAQDGMFDEVAESVEVELSDPAFQSSGLISACVRGVDLPGNIGTEECTTIVIYDPSGGFVTGGGWIDSPAGAYNGLENSAGVVRVDANPDGGWVFNPDPSNATLAEFTSAEAKIGSGSLHAGLITNTDANQEKFILAYVPADNILISDVGSFSIDFLIDASGANQSANQFYINAYALLPGGTNFYDCRFDYVASSGSTTEWTTLGVTGGSSPTQVADPSDGFTCPSTLEGMPAGSTVAFVVNMGDTSGSDTDLGGYFDNAQLTMAGSTTTFDFEPGPSPEGKATFGFVAKYKKGASTPDGNTQFTFKAGDLDFHSTSYDWLVVNQNDSNAQFKGEGTVNGEPGYSFMLWAGDHDDGDTFRIRITGPGGLVYDNGSDQVIGGGSVIVHSGKGKE